MRTQAGSAIAGVVALAIVVEAGMPFWGAEGSSPIDTAPRR
jgi:hypothetical protein